MDMFSPRASQPQILQLRRRRVSGRSERAAGPCAPLGVSSPGQRVGDDVVFSWQMPHVEGPFAARLPPRKLAGHGVHDAFAFERQGTREGSGVVAQDRHLLVHEVVTPGAKCEQ